MYHTIASLLKLTIVIYHADAVASAELLRAEAVASGILRQAGVEVTWRAAVAGDVAPGPDEIPLHLLPNALPQSSPHTGGYAILMDERSYAGVSWPAVQSAAAGMETDRAVVLGAVIAHELGHVLLRTREHATSGVMVYKLGAREIQAAARGELQFLRSEAKQIRAEAVRRAAPRVQ